MKQFILVVLFILILAINASAATSVYSIGSDGSRIVNPAITTVAQAAAHPALANSEVHFKGAFTVYSSANGWPADRKMVIDSGGTITASTSFRINGPFEAGTHKVFGTSGRILFGQNAIKTALVDWWGVVGVTDVAPAINSAIVATATYNQVVQMPAGSYLSGQFVTRKGLVLEGYGSAVTHIKAKNGLNAGLVVPSYTLYTSTLPATQDDEVVIRGIHFDGNKANNTSGTTLYLYGSKTVLDDVTITNSPATGVITNWNGPVGGNRLTGAEGHYTHVVIDSANGNGWEHYGPGDSRFDSIIIPDAGLGADNTYYSMLFNSTGRVSDFHAWNRDAATNTPIAAAYINTGGNGGMTFTNSHFESGHTALYVNGSGNIFQSCFYYAPSGPYAVKIIGNNNILTGIVGAYYRSSNPHYGGVYLNGWWNQINVADLGNGSDLGTVTFASGERDNIVNITGWNPIVTGVPYTGTPDPTDQVTVMYSANGTLTRMNQQPAIPWTAFTPTITAQTGTITTSSATGRYRVQGKTVNVEYNIAITTNGTGTGSIVASLPPGLGTSAYPFIISGREAGVSGTAVHGYIGVSGTVMNIFRYDNSYPGANGANIILTGTYEIP